MSFYLILETFLKQGDISENLNDMKILCELGYFGIELSSTLFFLFFFEVFVCCQGVSILISRLGNLLDFFSIIYQFFFLCTWSDDCSHGK